MMDHFQSETYSQVYEKEFRLRLTIIYLFFRLRYTIMAMLYESMNTLFVSYFNTGIQNFIQPYIRNFVHILKGATPST
jgi:hypothetical protein